MSDHRNRSISIPVTRGTMEAKGPTTVRVTSSQGGKMADGIEGLSEDEQAQAQALRRVLTQAVERLETAEGPADDLQTAGVVNALDEIIEAKNLAGSVLRKLNLLLED